MGSRGCEFAKVVWTKAAVNYHKVDRLFNKYHDKIQKKTLIKAVGWCAGGYTWVNHALSTVEADLQVLKEGFPQMEREIRELKSDVEEVANDSRETKREIRALKSEVEEVANDSKETKREIRALKSEVEEVANDSKETKKTVKALKEALVLFPSYTQSPVPPGRGVLCSYMRQEDLAVDARRKRWMV